MDLRGTQLLDAQLSQPLAHVNGLLEALALDDAGAQSTGKGITGTVGVVDLLLGDRVDGVLLDLGLALDGHDGGLGALRHDGHALALLVLLGQVRHQLRDLLDVLGAVALGLGPGGSLGLVADHVVPVGGAGVEGLLEELGDEGRREGEDEDLVLRGGLLCELHDCWRADCGWGQGSAKEKKPMMGGLWAKGAAYR